MSNAEKPTIKFEFTLDEVNGILAGLAKGPAESSLFGIQLIQQHAAPQVEALRIEEAKELAKKSKGESDE